MIPADDVRAARLHRLERFEVSIGWIGLLLLALSAVAWATLPGSLLWSLGLGYILGVSTAIPVTGCISGWRFYVIHSDDVSRSLRWNPLTWVFTLSVVILMVVFALAVHEAEKMNHVLGAAFGIGSGVGGVVYSAFIKDLVSPFIAEWISDFIA